MYHSGCPAAQGPAARHAMQQAMALDCQVPKSSASLNALSSAHTYVLRNMGFKHHLQMMIEHAKIAVTSSMHGHRISRAQCCTCLSISACITVALQHMQLVAWLHGHVCHNIPNQSHDNQALHICHACANRLNGIGLIFRGSCLQAAPACLSATVAAAVTLRCHCLPFPRPRCEP